MKFTFFFVWEDARLIEIIPLIYTLTVQGQYPVFNILNPPHGAPIGRGLGVVWLQWLMA